MSARRPLLAAALVTFAWAGIGCGPDASGSNNPDAMCTPADPAQLQTLNALTEAFNAQNLHELLLNVHPEVEWFNIKDGVMTREVQGARELGVMLGGYFSDCPTCRSKLEATCTMGSRVVIYEAASWEKGGQPATARSIAVYEFDAAKVRRVYYFETD